MEVSSHALSLGRVEGINFDVALFTNLSQDHLDYHKTMEDYLKAKIKILNNLKETGTLILNSDDDASKSFKFKKTFTVGLKGDYKILNYKFKSNKTILDFKFKDKEYKTTLNLINNFNIYNYLMVLLL